jgi:hypothetical protein
MTAQETVLLMIPSSSRTEAEWRSELVVDVASALAQLLLQASGMRQTARISLT